MKTLKEYIAEQQEYRVKVIGHGDKTGSYYHVKASTVKAAHKIAKDNHTSNYGHFGGVAKVKWTEVKNANGNWEPV